MTFDNRPFPWMRNRRVAAQPPEFLAAPRGALANPWLVCDRYGASDGAPMRYGSEGCAYEVSADVAGGWVVVNRLGQYLRTRGRWRGDNRTIRRFRTPLAAAIAAEAEDQ